MPRKKNSIKNSDIKSSKKQKVQKVKKTFILSAPVKRIVGLTLGLLSVYLFVSFFSYLFTWKIDQDKVEGVNFLNFVFTKQPFEISNWLGKLGAVISHRFIYNGFGIMAFLFPFYLGMLSLKILTAYSPFSLKKMLKVAVVALVWGSIFFGFFFNECYLFVGGNFGFQINQWLGDSVGKIGTFFLLLFSFLALTGAMFNSFLTTVFGKLKLQQPP